MQTNMTDSTEQQEPLSRTLTGGSDVVFDLTCQPCSGDNKTLEAVGFCVDCSEFLCDECYRYHLKPPLTRNHKLLDIEEAKKDKDITRYQNVCTEKCSQHRGEIVKFFCSDHDIIGCVACMTVDHRNCQGVKYIPDIAEDIVNGDAYSDLIRELDTVLLRTKCLITKSTENKAKSQSLCDKVLLDMCQFKEEVMDALEKLEKAMYSEAKKMQLKDTQKMDANIAKFDNVHHKADTVALKLKSMKDNGQFFKLFAVIKKEKCDITSLDDELDKVANDNTVNDYCLQPSIQLEELVKHKDNLGKLGQQVEVKSKATQVGEIGVRTDSDTGTCIIVGLARLPDGKLVAADNNNKKVKLVDVAQAKVISEVNLTGRPWDISVTDEADEMAVTLGSKRKLLLLKVSGDTLLKHREMKTSGSCYGVASVMDNLVVNLESPERLDIIDKYGNVLHKIVHDQNGKQLFSNVRNLAVSHDRGTIIFPDRTEHSVTSLSLSGKVKAVFTDTDLTGARCVAVDERGNVYVGGKDSKNVHQITPDCRKISTLLSHKDGIVDLCSLCFSSETNCLYVGQNSDTLLTFYLS